MNGSPLIGNNMVQLTVNGRPLDRRGLPFGTDAKHTGIMPVPQQAIPAQSRQRQPRRTESGMPRRRPSGQE